MIKTTLESLYGKDFMTDPDRIWKHIKEGREYWALLPGNHPIIHNEGLSFVALKAVKIVVTEKRKKIAIYRACDYPQAGERTFEKGSVMAGDLMPVEFCPEKELSEETLKILEDEKFDERFTKIIYKED